MSAKKILRKNFPCLPSDFGGLLAIFVVSGLVGHHPMGPCLPLLWCFSSECVCTQISPFHKDTALISDWGLFYCGVTSP